jgi:membrane-bound lytic murein transglycosylase D
VRIWLMTSWLGMAHAADPSAIEPTLTPATSMAMPTELNPDDYGFPVVLNPWVEQWIKYFTGPGRPTYAKWMTRAPEARAVMIPMLEEAEMPTDLVFLSMIESGYSNIAESPAGAVGMWQFIRPTGRMYGLKITRWIDERRDLLKATDAAIRLLRDLYEEYDDWYLAWAAYNCGGLRVHAAMRGYKTRDFWKLVEERALPLETMNYVPKLLAATIIGKHPKRYGFDDPEKQAKEPAKWPTVEVDASIGLDVVAVCYDSNRATLEKLNPHLVGWALPPDGSAIEIKVPMETYGALKCLRRIR